VFLFRPPRCPSLWPTRFSDWLVSWIISLHTRSVYSHVGIAYWLQANCSRRLAVFEATARYGIRLHPMDRYLEECQARRYSVDWYQLNGDLVDRERVAAYCRDQWGRPYASLLQLVLSFGLLGRHARTVFRMNPDQDPGRYFCSELCASAFRNAGYHPPEGVEHDPALTDPGSVARYSCLTPRGMILP
jgi:hypothetical protein